MYLIRQFKSMAVYFYESCSILASPQGIQRTEWSPILSVIIRVITKSDDHEAGVQIVNHEYDYRLTSYQLIIKITIFRKHK